MYDEITGDIIKEMFRQVEPSNQSIIGNALEARQMTPVEKIFVDYIKEGSRQFLEYEEKMNESLENLSGDSSKVKQLNNFKVIKDQINDGIIKSLNYSLETPPQIHLHEELKSKIVIPNLGIEIPDVTYKRSDCTDALYKIVSDYFAAKGDPVVNFQNCSFRVNIIEYYESGDVENPVDLENGASLISLGSYLEGTIYLEGDIITQKGSQSKEKNCLNYKFGDSAVADFYMCTACSDSVCENCKNVCHKDHRCDLERSQVTIYDIRCECYRKGNCKLKNQTHDNN